MAARAELKGKISLDNQEFISKLRSSLSAARTFSNDVAVGMLKASGAMWALRKVVSEVEGTWESLKRSFEFGSLLSEISRRTGMTVGSLYQLRMATKKSGVEFESIAGPINKMQKAISGVNMLGQSTANSFASLGLKLADLQAMSPEEQFQTIGKAIGELKNPLNQSAVAMGIFGKSGGELLKIFNNPNVHLDFMKPPEGAARVMQMYAGSMEQVDRALKKMQSNFQKFFIGMAGPVSMVLAPVLDKLTSTDFSGIGLKFGNSIATAVRVLYNAFQDGSLGEVIKLSLMVAFEQASAYLAGGLRATAMAFGDTITGLFNTEFENGLGNIFIGIAEKFGAAFMDAISKPLNYAQAFLEYDINKKDALNNAGAAYKDAKGMRDKAGQAYRIYEDMEKIDKGNPKNQEWFQRGQNFDKTADRLTAEGDKYKETSSMSRWEYAEKHANDKRTLLGKTSEQLDAGGNAKIKIGVAIMKPIVENVANKALANIGAAKKIDMFGDSRPALNKLTEKLRNQAIPGEGTVNDESGVPVDPEEDELFRRGKKKLERMHRGLDGMTNSLAQKGVLGRLGGSGINGDSLADDMKHGTFSRRMNTNMDALNPMGMNGEGINPTMAQVKENSKKTAPLTESQKHTKILEKMNGNMANIDKKISLVLAT